MTNPRNRNGGRNSAASILETSARTRVLVKSTADGTDQPCYVTLPEGIENTPEPAPLVLLLHPWSFGVEHRQESFEAEAIDRGWILAVPHFRGPNDHPDACGLWLVESATGHTRRRFVGDCSIRCESPPNLHHRSLRWRAHDDAHGWPTPHPLGGRQRLGRRGIEGTRPATTGRCSAGRVVVALATVNRSIGSSGKDHLSPSCIVPPKSL